MTREDFETLKEDFKSINGQFDMRAPINFFYVPGHPAGYTDDLGIMSDVNRYVREETAGYVSLIHPRDFSKIRDWCEQNFERYEYELTMYDIKFYSQKHVSWFMLRWG